MPEPTTRLLMLIAVLALPLGGCASMTDISVADLNPLKGSDPLRSADYNYFYKRDQTATGFVSATDLIGPDGRCAFDSAPRAAPAKRLPRARKPRRKLPSRSTRAATRRSTSRPARRAGPQAPRPARCRPRYAAARAASGCR